MRVLRRNLPAENQPAADKRRGASTLDYILVIGVILPLATIVVPTGMRMARAVYEMITVFVAWPFL